jgi:hypothetical protein
VNLACSDGTELPALEVLRHYIYPYLDPIPVDDSLKQFFVKYCHQLSLQFFNKINMGYMQLKSTRKDGGINGAKGLSDYKAQYHTIKNLWSKL